VTATATATEQRIAEAREQAQSLDGRPRHHSFSKIEVRAKDDGGFVFEGNAAVFDQLSEDLGGFREMIKRGAFKPVLEDDVRFLFNHNPDFVLARTTSGTLDLEEKPGGLRTEADVAPVSYADDIRILIERGDISGMSFAFRVAEDSWFEDDEGNLIRTIHKFEELFDVSVVTYPAYPQTDAAVRAIEKLRRGDDLSAQERGAIEDLTRPHSPKQDTEERASAADGAEPAGVAEVSGSRAEGEDGESGEGGLSGRSARVRVRALQARL